MSGTMYEPNFAAWNQDTLASLARDLFRQVNAIKADTLRMDYLEKLAQHEEFTQAGLTLRDHIDAELAKAA